MAELRRVEEVMLVAVACIDERCSSARLNYVGAKACASAYCCFDSFATVHQRATYEPHHGATNLYIQNNLGNRLVHAHQRRVVRIEPIQGSMSVSLKDMTRTRFEFALQNVHPTLWEHFENLATTFLTDEYSKLRTLAGHADKGRDAILWQPEDEPTVIIQCSLRKDWEQKITESAKLIYRNFSDTRILVYVTNQRIGPKADEQVAIVRKKYGLFLDIRDATWFLDRENRSRATATAADEFSRPIVDPILAKSSLIETSDDSLTSAEGKAAVIFLSMQFEDSSRERGLTKLSYDALVRAALKDSHNENRMSRDSICATVKRMIQNDDEVKVEQYTNAALDRLKKHSIRHWMKEDEFCLTFEERQRRTEALVRLELLDHELDLELLESLRWSYDSAEQPQDDDDLENLIPIVRRVLERFLLQRGEAFAQSLSDGQMVLFSQEEIEAICVDQLNRVSGDQSNAVTIIGTAIESVLVRPTKNTQEYLRALADAYTLFAFLRQVPDVQRAVQKLFSYGRIWLDTSAALPLLAEMLLDEEERSYTRTLRAACDAGMDLFVTPGVVEELFYHINHSRKCQQLGAEWRSRTPFLYSAYLWSGRPVDDFTRWTVEFIGTSRPLDDIVDFLFEIAKIKRRSLIDEVEKADDTLRFAVDEYWRKLHRGRSRAYDASRDPQVADSLADHDIENFLGVIVARQSESRVNSLGHEHWWLTLDRRAYRAASEICSSEGIASLDSPVMSFDFLIDYLAVGPRRSDVSRSEEKLLPLMLDMSLLDGIPEDIREVAEAARSEMSGFSDRLVRREIRDRLDAAKLRRGPVARAGIDAIEQDIREAFVS